MALFSRKNFSKVLALVMAICLILSCFAGCSGDSGSNSNNYKGDKVKYEWNGLIYYLDKDFKDTNIGGSEYASHNDGDLVVVVSDDATPAGVTDSSSYAQQYAAGVNSQLASVKVESKNGISYTICDFGDGFKEARAFYVNGDHAWMFYVTTGNFNSRSDEIITMITSAEIDKDYQYTNSGSNTGNNSGNSGSSTVTPSEPGNNGGSTVTPSEPDNNGNNNGGNSNNGNAPSGLVAHEWEGLTYYLRSSYSSTATESYAMHVSGDTTVMVISGKAPAGATDSRSFAQLYINDMAEDNFTAQLSVANGVHYTVTDWGDGTTEVRGFYVYNGYAWNIYGTTYDYDVDGTNLITYATTGQIDENYQHDTDSGDNSGSNSGTSGGSSGSGNVAPSPNDPGTSGNVTVYTYVPASWGAPACWAWKDGGDNAFAQWPGESMLWIGKYYATQVPSWVDHVIINGNNGNIQTEDIAVESGKNVWIIIHASGDYYSVFYSYPTNAQMAEMGY